MLGTLFPTPGPPIQFSKTDMAVCHKRAHAEFFSEGESLAIMLLGFLNFRCSGVGANLSHKPQRPRLLTSFHGLLRAIKRALHNCNSVIKPASLKIRFA